MGLIETTRGLLPGAGKTQGVFKKRPGAGFVLYVESSPWRDLSCRGQSAAAADGRHHPGQGAHIHRWNDLETDHAQKSTKGDSKTSLWSGRRVGGQAALDMGLVNRAVEQNQAGDAAYREALSLAREILPQVRKKESFSSSSSCSGGFSSHLPFSLLLFSPGLCHSTYLYWSDTSCQWSSEEVAHKYEPSQSHWWV